MENWQRIEQLFQAACERPAHEREKFIRDQCPGDDVLLHEVMSLLDSDSQAGAYLQTSALDLIGETVAATDDDQQGRRIGPYRLIRRIGAGGMGAVYLAQRDDAQFEHTVAIKLIKRGMDTDEIVRRFRRERQVLARLSHPNIARLFDGGTTDDGLPWFAMEHVDGVPIDQWCGEHRLPVEARLELFCTVCDAIHYAHQNLIVHRDLKPGNILVTNDGVAKALDFGIARLLSGDADGEALTIDAGSRCTPAYASPEQIRGEAITTASDVYSLSVILYELLTERSPYRLKIQTNEQLSSAVCNDPPLRPSTALRDRKEHDAAFQGSIDPVYQSRILAPGSDLETIILKSLAKEPHLRYGSALQLAEDIRRWMRHEPIEARPPSSLYKAQKFIRRNAALTGAAAVVFLVLLVAVAATSAGMASARRSAAEAQRQTRIAESIVRFLNDDLLAAADPEFAAGREITVRQVVDDAAHRLDGAALEPLVEAGVRITLGRTYRGLGAFNESAVHLERAHALRASSLGDRHPQTLAAADQYAVTLAALGRYAEAEPIADRIFEISRRASGEEHPDTLRFLNNRASLHQSRGRYEAAERDRRFAFEASRRVNGEDHRDTIDFGLGLASLLHQQSSFSEAQSLLEDMLAQCRRARGEDHPTTLIAINNLARLYDDQRRFDLSEPLHIEVLSRKRRVLGDEHASTLTSMNNLGLLYIEQQRYDDARPLLEECLGLTREALGPDHPDTLGSLNNLALLARRMGDLAEAERLWLEALEGQTRIFGGPHPHTINTLGNLARLYQRQEQFEQASEFYARALHAARDAESPDRLHLAALLAAYGMFLASRGEEPAALGHLEESHGILREVLGPDDVRSNQVMNALHDVKSRLGLP